MCFVCSNFNSKKMSQFTQLPPELFLYIFNFLADFSCHDYCSETNMMTIDALSKQFNEQLGNFSEDFWKDHLFKLFPINCDDKEWMTVLEIMQQKKITYKRIFALLSHSKRSTRLMGNRDEKIRKPKTYSLVVLGVKGVGKSHMVYQYLQNFHFEIGENMDDMYRKQVTVCGKVIEVEIKNTSGQEGYYVLLGLYSFWKTLIENNRFHY